MSADIPNLQIGEAESVVLAIVATETVLRNAVTTVAAALLPGAVLRLPAMCTRTLPGDLLLADLSRAPSLSIRIGLLLLLLLTLLPLLILLSSGLLLSGGIGLLLLLLTLLPLLILLALGLLLFRGVILLLTLLPLLILLALGLLLLCGVILLLTLLPLLILLALGLLLLCGVILLLTLLPLLILLLPLRLCRLLLFRRFILFLLFVRLVLPRARRSGEPEHQKKRCRNDVSNWFHFLSPLNFLLKPPRVLRRADCQAHVSFTGKTLC